MASQTEICNLSLTYLGEERISKITDPAEPARKLNALWVASVKALLEMHPWNFATKRATLGQLLEVPDHKYSFFFQLPSDCIRVIRLNDRDAEYRVEGNRIATDESTVEIEYIAYISDSSKYPPLFVEALAAKLGYELALSITSDDGTWDRMEKLLTLKLSKATFSDSQQGTPAPLVRNRWIEERSR